MGKGSLLQRLGLARKPPLMIAQFREQVIEEVLRRQPGADLERLGDSDLKGPSGGETALGRAYAYYRETPRERELVIGQVADLVLHEPGKATPDELMVLVRPHSFLAGSEGETDRGLARSLPAGLIAVVAVDKPERYEFPMASELRDDLGLSDAEIWARAEANLLTRVNMTPPKARTGVLMGIKTDIGLASSLLTVDAFWEHSHLASLGDLVVAPVERDELVVVPADQPELVHALRNLVARRDNSNFLCDRLLLRRNGAWEDFE